MGGLDVWPSCVISDCSDTQGVFKPEPQNTVNTFTVSCRLSTRLVSPIGVILGSARVSRAGDGVLGIANFSYVFDPASHEAPKSSFRRDAESSTRDACAT
jgi:hypothetical protein